MNKKIKIILAIIIFFALSNFTPLSIVFSLFTDEGHYQYSNYNGSNINEERVFKPGKLVWIKRLHKIWIDKNPNVQDKKLYRLFWKNPLEFWRWRSYFFDERYQLPYKSKNEIIELRTN